MGIVIIWDYLGLLRVLLWEVILVFWGMGLIFGEKGVFLG